MTATRDGWWAGPADPDVWRLGQLGRTDVVIEFLATCVPTDRHGSSATAWKAIPRMLNGDMIAAILNARDARQAAAGRTLANRAWDIHHPAKRHETA